MVLTARSRAVPPSASAAFVTKVSGRRCCAVTNDTEVAAKTLIASTDTTTRDVMVRPRRRWYDGQRAGAAGGGGGGGPRLSRSSPVSLSILRTRAVSPPARAGAAVITTLV